jgi:Xaa-Pro aminopeptidase
MNHRQIRYNNIRNALGVLTKSIYIPAITPSKTIDPLFLYVTMMAIHQVATDYIAKITSNQSFIKIKLYTSSDLPTSLNYINNKQRNKLNKLRVIKDDWELYHLQISISATVQLFDKLTTLIKTEYNLTEHQLALLYYKELYSRNYTTSYLPIIASNENASIIHYNKYNSRIPRGSVILMDCGFRNEFGYCSDVTRTIINPNSPLQIQLFNMVKEAYKNCVNFVKKHMTNVTFNQIEEICVQTLIQQFGRLQTDKNHKEWSKGIINCRSNMPESRNFSRNFIRYFYTHSIGHNIGLETHDPTSGVSFLQKRCVFTIEPGLYFDKSTIPFSIPSKYYKIGGIRIEDMFMISTKNKLLCLTQNVQPFVY